MGTPDSWVLGEIGVEPSSWVPRGAAPGSGVRVRAGLRSWRVLSAHSICPGGESGLVLLGPRDVGGGGGMGGTPGAFSAGVDSRVPEGEVDLF